MKKEYLNRITFLEKNKFLIDETIRVNIHKSVGATKFVIENECGPDSKEFEDENLLFDYVDEMTDTGSVGGGYEGPGLAPANSLIKKTFGPYSDIVEAVEKTVKKALIEEYVKEHPAYNLTELYREANRKESENHIKEVENGIKIVYGHILPPVIRNYYQDNGDYNGDGIPNQHKENNSLLDLQYDGNVSDAFKERVKKSLTDVPAIGNAANPQEKSETGLNMLKAAERKAELKSANPTNSNIIQLGNDIEFQHNMVNTEKPKEKTTHRHGVAALGFKLQEGQMLRFKFKTKIFENRDVLIESVPAKVKEEGAIFEMQDSKGNSFTMLWEDGTATILEEKNLLKEADEINHIQKMFEYKTPVQKKFKKVNFDLFTNPSKTRLLKEEFEDEMRDKVNSLNTQNLEGRAVSKILDELNRKYGGYGVETVLDYQNRPFYGDIALEYINMGDSYTSTIIYDVDKKEFAFDNIGEYTEKNNMNIK